MSNDQRIHLIIGAGPVGTSTALRLADAGDEVHVVTRSGSGPDHPAIIRHATDATDTDALVRLVPHLDTIVNCANPPYTSWERDWPPLATAVLDAARRTGAVLVTMSNLYGYALSDGPLTEASSFDPASRKGEVRARMWREALAAHERGEVRVTEARASDFFGPGVVGAHLGEHSIPALLAGKKVRVLGRTDVPHTYTYMDDVAATLVTLGRDDRAWGRAWHVPSNAPRTQQQALSDIATAAGAPAPRLAPTSAGMVRAIGMFNRELRELAEIQYQFARPFVMDSSAATSTFGLTATPWDDAVSATAAWWRRHLGLDSLPTAA